MTDHRCHSCPLACLTTLPLAAQPLAAPLRPTPQVRSRVMNEGHVRGAGRSNATARNREALLQRVAAMLPGRSLQDVMAHDDWHTAACLAGRRRRAVIEVGAPGSPHWGHVGALGEELWIAGRAVEWGGDGGGGWQAWCAQVQPVQ